MSRPSRFRIWPFRIIAKASKPAKVLRAVRKQPKPSPGRTRRLMRRWSCSTIGAIAYPQMRADPFLKLLGIGLDPTEDRRVVHLDTAVDEHELEIAVTDREHQIPTNGPQNLQ